MGQANRRKQQLGSLYGTPNHSTNLSTFDLRWMNDQEIESVRHLGDSRTQFVVATVDGKPVWLLVRPVIDKWGQFNSHVSMLGQKGMASVLGKHKKIIHRSVNSFLMQNADVIIS